MPMDILGRFSGGSSASSHCHARLLSRNLSSSSSSSPPLKPYCSRKGPSSPQPQNNGGDKGDKTSADWDKAWSKFRKQGKKTLFSQFSPNKYVSWNPRRSEYPLSEEVDPIKRTERTNLMLWTSPQFTLGLAIILVTFLLIYTILSPVPLK